MHRRNRLRTLAFLMGLSFLMLAGFTWRWLSVQYGEEKMLLNNKLKSVFDKKMGAYFDQAFKLKYLGAYNRNDSGLSAGNSLHILNDSADIAAQIAQQIPARSADSGFSVSGTSRTILMRHEVSFDKDSAFTKKHTNQKTEMRIDVLPDGVVSRSAQISDTFSNPVDGMIRDGIINILSGLEVDVLDLGMDTAAFKKEMAALMSKNYPGISYTFHNGSAPGSMVVVPVAKNRSSLSFSIGNYHWFLLKSLLPQIGFCAALLGLCSVAFLLSYFTVRQQLKLTEQKNDFISNMSHELKTPVTTAQLALEAFTHFDLAADPQKTKDYIAIATWEMKRLEMLVANVLNNARLEEGRILFQKELVIANELLTQFAQQLSPVCRELQKNLSFENSTEIQSVYGDKLHLQGALYNVIDNAVKYGKNTILVRLSDDGANVLIRVTDDGPGVPKEYRNKIFDKLFRIPNGNEHLVKGHGLGLHYARYVIEQHGGKISVEDGVHGGAVFSVSLPKHTPHEN